MDDKFWLFECVLSWGTGNYVFSKEKWDTNWKLVHQILNAIVAFLTFVFTTGFVLLETQDLTKWIEGLCIWITAFIMYMLVAINFIFRRQIREFLEEVIFRDSMMEMPFIERVMTTTKEGGKLKQLKDLVVATEDTLVKYTTRLLTFYVGSTISTSLLYNGDAIYKMIIREDESLRLFAYGMWFPWDLEDLRVYSASFIFHTYAGLHCVFIYPGVQCTIMLMLGQIIRQLHILTFVTLHLDDLVMETVHVRDQRWQAECTAILTQCVEHYLKIKRFGHRLNKIWQSFYLILIFTAIVIVCVCSVKIAITSMFSINNVRFYMHGFLFAMMVLMFSGMGQQIMNQCENLEAAVLEKWFIYNKKHQVHVMIFHRALMQSMPIYIFGHISLSMPMFNWFLKTGMSVFTLAMSLLEEHQI